HLRAAAFRRGGARRGLPRAARPVADVRRPAAPEPAAARTGGRPRGRGGRHALDGARGRAVRLRRAHARAGRGGRDWRLGLRPDAIDIIRHARARGLMTSLNSNAWLAGERIDELAGALDLLVVSLDGPEPVHDLVRRRRGSYARVLAVLDAARARGLATATIT